MRPPPPRRNRDRVRAAAASRWRLPRPRRACSRAFSGMTVAYGCSWRSRAAIPARRPSASPSAENSRFLGGRPAFAIEKKHGSGTLKQASLCKWGRRCGGGLGRDAATSSHGRVPAPSLHTRRDLSMRAGCRDAGHSQLFHGASDVRKRRRPIEGAVRCCIANATAQDRPGGTNASPDGSIATKRPRTACLRPAQAVLIGRSRNHCRTNYPRRSGSLCTYCRSPRLPSCTPHPALDNAVPCRHRQCERALTRASTQKALGSAKNVCPGLRLFGVARAG